MRRSVELVFADGRWTVGSDGKPAADHGRDGDRHYDLVSGVAWGRDCGVWTVYQAGRYGAVPVDVSADAAAVEAAQALSADVAYRVSEHGIVYEQRGHFLVLDPLAPYPAHGYRLLSRRVDGCAVIFEGQQE